MAGATLVALEETLSDVGITARDTNVDGRRLSKAVNFDPEGLSVIVDGGFLPCRRRLLESRCELCLRALGRCRCSDSGVRTGVPPIESNMQLNGHLREPTKEFN